MSEAADRLPAAGRFLCHVRDVPDGGAKGFWFGSDAARRGIFLIRRGDAVAGYVNSCPHRGTPLDWQPDRFLDVTGRLILCATHGALFRIADGYCVSGPCTGKRLAPVALARHEDAIHLIEEGEDYVG
jgi:nitrite reductase/ring-hydroxylating ferredoxin subunit